MVPQKPASGAGVPRVRLGELLVKAGVISDAQLRDALKEQKQWGGKLGDILVRMQVLSEDVFVRALSKQLALPRADVSGEIPLEALARVPAEIAEEYEIVPLALLDEGRAIAIATADPLNATALDAVRASSGLRPVAHVATASWVRAAIARLYQSNAPHSSPGYPMAPPAYPSPAASQSPAAAPRSSQGTVLAPGAQGGVPLATYAQPTPAQGFPSPFTSAAPQPPPPAVPAVPDPRIAALEESYRREVQALKALVEVLVQRGVIDLDEYLSKLRR